MSKKTRCTQNLLDCLKSKFKPQVNKVNDWKTLSDVKSWLRGEDHWAVAQQKIQSTDPAATVSLQIPVTVNIHPETTNEPYGCVIDWNMSLDALISRFKVVAQQNGAEYKGAPSEDEESLLLTISAPACVTLKLLRALDVEFTKHKNSGRGYAIFGDCSAVSVNFGSDSIEEDEPIDIHYENQQSIRYQVATAQ